MPLPKLYRVELPNEYGPPPDPHPLPPPQEAVTAYQADNELALTVNLILALGLPLLVTGEPGTGKTALAYSIAYQLGLPLLRFDTKTTSVAADLLYTYDPLRRYEAAMVDRDLQTGHAPPPPRNFIQYGPLGTALRRATGERIGTKRDAAMWTPPLLRRVNAETNELEDVALPEDDWRLRSSVVLIDEIDKAPRDFPNDLLREMGELSFYVRETNETFSATPLNRPVVILTSNGEREFPDAFLRRVAAYNIQFRDSEAELLDMVNRLLLYSPSAALATDPASSDATATQVGIDRDIVGPAVVMFRRIRENRGLIKPPATAELLLWLRALTRRGVPAALLTHLKEAADRGSPDDDGSYRDLLAPTYAVLAKYPEDASAIISGFHGAVSRAHYGAAGQAA